MNKTHAVQLVGLQRNRYGAGATGQKWSCQFCTYYTEYKKNLKPHIRRRHKDEYLILYGEVERK